MTLPRPTRKIVQEKEATPVPTAEPAPTPKKKKYLPSDVFMLEPQSDISAYELACLLKLLYEPAIHFKSYLNLPENLQRHFQSTKL